MNRPFRNCLARRGIAIRQQQTYSFIATVLGKIPSERLRSRWSIWLNLNHDIISAQPIAEGQEQARRRSVRPGAASPRALGRPWGRLGCVDANVCWNELDRRPSCHMVERMFMWMAVVGVIGVALRTLRVLRDISMPRWLRPIVAGDPSRACQAPYSDSRAVTRRCRRAGRPSGAVVQMLPAPIIKVRLARADEKAAYDEGGKGAEYCNAVRVVYLVDMASRPWVQTG
jgi:hypothetical protein